MLSCSRITCKLTNGQWHADPELEFYVQLYTHNDIFNSWLVVFFVCGSAQGFTRTTLSFGLMLQQQTRQWCGSYFPPVPAALHWNGYGCWCGIGGGGTPVDEFDAVCKAHDECWGALRNPGEICHGVWGWGHFLAYRWRWADNEVSMGSQVR